MITEVFDDGRTWFSVECEQLRSRQQHVGSKRSSNSNTPQLPHAAVAMASLCFVAGAWAMHGLWRRHRAKRTARQVAIPSAPLKYAGGHAGGVRIAVGGDIVFKSFQTGHGRGTTELRFLQHMARRRSDLSQFVPRFVGVFQKVSAESKVVSSDIKPFSFVRVESAAQYRGDPRDAVGWWIGIESVTKGYRLPCFLDLKLSAGLPADGSKPVGHSGEALTPMTAARIEKKRQRARKSTLYEYGVKVVAGTLVQWERRPGRRNCNVRARSLFGIKHGFPCTTYTDLFKELQFVLSSRMKHIRAVAQIGAPT